MSSFLPYPIDVNLLFKATLATKFAFRSLHEFTLALHFKDVFLPKILSSRIG